MHALTKPTDREIILLIRISIKKNFSFQSIDFNIVEFQILFNIAILLYLNLTRFLLDICNDIFYLVLNVVNYKSILLCGLK